MEFFTLQELLDQEVNYRKKLFSDGIDGVKADDIEKVITLNEWYHIPADQCKTKYDLLHWIAHLSQKNWVTVTQIRLIIETMSAWNGFSPYHDKA